MNDLKCRNFDLGRSAVSGLLLGTAVMAGAADSPTRSYEGYRQPTVVAKLDHGRSISWVCVGSGSPTVIMTAGAGDWSAAWRKVQPEIGRTTRACAWDRAGFGLSSPSSDVQDLTHTEADLEAALTAADIRGPYVLVGHSLGSYETLRFADRHPEKVVGIVLVDPAIPDQFRLFASRYPGVAKLQLSINAQNEHDLQACIDGEAKGSIKPGAAGWPDCMGDDPEYPDVLRSRLSQLAGDPDRLKTELSFFASDGTGAEQVINPRRTYGNKPLIVLTATDTPDLPPAMAPKELTAELKAMQAHLWTAEHDHIASLSTKGRNILVTGTTHYIQLIKPEAVIAATAQVVANARKRQS